MRPLLAASVAVVVLGGMKLYIDSAQPKLRPQLIQLPKAADGVFSLDVTLTFAAGPDPFALDLADAPSLLIQLQGRDLMRKAEIVSAGEKLTVDGIEDIVQGANEFYVQATPQASNAVSRAIRIRVLRDNVAIAEQTLWSAPGEPVQGAVIVDVPANNDDLHDPLTTT